LEVCDEDLVQIADDRMPQINQHCASPLSPGARGRADGLATTPPTDRGFPPRADPDEH
jgi:hypothetical protein